MNAASDALRVDAQQAERAHATDYYRADIDGLRAVAVLAVIGFHAYPDYFPGGFVGVDVFFVISGFLITSIILRQLRRSTFTLADFYSRRIRRIFPALVVVLPACLLFGWFALLPDELEHLGKHVAAASGFVSNFALWQESGYFDRAAELKPLLHLWSLGIEEQFYLVWPVLLLLLWKRQHNVVLTIAFLTTASFLLSVAVGRDKPIANFYFPFSRFWELGLGCLLAVAGQSSGSLQRWVSNHPVSWLTSPALVSYARSALPIVRSVLPIIGIGLIGAAMFLLDRRSSFPGWAALLPTLGAACVIAAGADSWFQRRIMASAVLVLIGTISYPLYLWHWPMLSFATILESGTPENAIRITAVLLSVALAWLTFKFVERPVRAQRAVRVTLTLAGSLLILGVSGAAIYAASGFNDRVDFDVRAIRPEPRRNSLCVDRFPKHGDFNYCKSTSAGQPAAIFLGDSQAQAIYDGMAAMAGAEYPMMLLGRGGCPPLLNVPNTNEQGCYDVWNLFVKYVAEVRPRVVVVVGGGSPLLQGSDAALAVDGIPFALGEDAYRNGLRALIAALQKISPVIYVREIPRFESAPSCFLRSIRLPGSQCSPTVARSTVEERMASYNRVVDDIREEFPELRVVDSISAICDPKVCSQKLRSGEIIYSDSMHLSPAGGRHFARTSALSGMMLEELKADPVQRASSASVEP